MPNYAAASNGSTATATSNILSPSLAIDEVNYRPGGTAHDWLSAADPSVGTPQELVVDFGTTRNISGWRLFQLWNQTSPPSNSDTISGNGFGGAYGAEDYTIKVYDGSWHVVATKTGQTLIIQSGSFTPGNYTKGMVSITKSTGGGTVDVAELEFWDSLPDPNPPTVSITDPLDDDSVTGTIDVDVTCSDDVGVSSLQLKVDGTNSGSAYTGSGLTGHTFSLNTALLSNGAHELTVVASDGVNTTTSASITINVENPPVVDVAADDTSLIIDQTVTLTDNSTNVDDYTVDWGDGDTGTDPNGSHSYSAIGTYTITITGTNAFGEDSVEINVTVVDVDFDPFEVLQHVKMLNINGLGWGAPIIEAKFGGGFGAGIIANQDYGLHRWTIASEFLPDHSDYEIDALIDSESVTQKYFTYVFEFFKRHTLRGNKPFIIKEHRTGNYYLVRFAMGGQIDFGRLTAKFFTNEGIQVEEARTNLEGFTFADDGSVTKS